MNIKTYKTMKGPSLTPIFYLYMGNYTMGRILGTTLTLLVVAASIVMGIISNNIVLDTICYAFSIGSFIYNYMILMLLFKGYNTGYFTEGIADKHFHALKKILGTMIMLSRFVELYTIFLISVASLNLFIKIVLSVLFTAVLVTIKILNNFIENKKSSIIIRNTVVQVIVFTLGIIISNNLTYSFYNNITLLLIFFVIGFAIYALDKKLRNFFKAENKNIREKNELMSVTKIRGIFRKEIFNEIPKKNKVVENKPMTKEEYKKDRKRIIYEMDREDINILTEISRTAEKERKEERERKERERKEAAERRVSERLYKSAESKVEKRETLTKEEKSMLERTVKNTKLTKNNDRTKIKR